MKPKFHERFVIDASYINFGNKEPAAKTSPVPDTTELVAALRSATEALLHGQPQQAD